jgi:hypothetical protein
MDKRTGKRIPIGIEADIISDYRNHAAFIGNLSPRGLHLITVYMKDDKDSNGKTEIDLNFLTHTGEKLNLHCKKRWSYAITPNSLINRVGMEIINPPAQYKEFLTTLK